MPDSLKEQIDKNRCPLCTRGAKITSGEMYTVECETCGKYRFTTIWIACIKETDKELLPYLSIHTRQAHERGERVELNPLNWKEFALAHAQTRLADKVMKLLELAAARSKPGFSASLDIKSDPPLVGAPSPGEFSYLLEHLNESGFIGQSGDDIF